MSKENSIYSKPVIFMIVAVCVILVGSLITTFLPMLMPGMHPKLENLKPYTPLELAGRDVYQKEGCVNCHTQTVRPLKTEVMRYGEYSKAGEFTYDHPFLWGSKRTGPDLARVGKKYPDSWHYKHFENPKAFFEASNMPVYGWLKENKLDPSSVKTSMDALGFPYTEDQIKALDDKTELDAIVAYLQVLGTAVKKKKSVSKSTDIAEKNPLAGNADALAKGKTIYASNCAACHGEAGEGGIGPSITDEKWLDKETQVSDKTIYLIIANGTEQDMEIDGLKAAGGMPPFSGTLNKDKIWSLVTFIRELK